MTEPNSASPKTRQNQRKEQHKKCQKEVRNKKPIDWNKNEPTMASFCLREDGQYKQVNKQEYEKWQKEVHESIEKFQKQEWNSESRMNEKFRNT